MKCLVNLLCTLLIASVSIKNNVSQILLRTTDFQNSYWDILIILIIVIFAVGILALCDLAFLEEDRRYRKINLTEQYHNHSYNQCLKNYLNP